MLKQNLLKKYKGKPLAKTCYKTVQDTFFTDTFADPEKLLYFLYEMDCGENILTEEGLAFLEEYYTLEQVADMIIAEIKKGIDYKFTETEKDKIILWLKEPGS